MAPYYKYGVVPGNDDLYAERVARGYAAILSYADLVMNGKLDSQGTEDVQKKNAAIGEFASEDVQIAFGFMGERNEKANYEYGRAGIAGVSDPVEYFKELSSTFAEIVRLDILDSYRSDVASTKANRESYLRNAQGIVRDFQQSYPDPMLQHPLFMLLQNIGVQLNLVENLTATHVTHNAMQSMEARSTLNADKYNQQSQVEIEARAQGPDESNDAGGECAKDESGEDCKLSS
jgi:hypothetical protein